MDKKLDQLDIKLLACLQADNQLTADMLAETVGLSPSAVARRLRQLRASRRSPATSPSSPSRRSAILFPRSSTSSSSATP